MKTITKLFLALALCVGLFAQSSVTFDAKTGVNTLVNAPDISTADPFAASTVIELNVRYYVAAANNYNRVVIANYNLDVSNYKLQSAGGATPVNPAPVVPNLKSVNADVIRTKLSAFPFQVSDADALTLVKYIPPAPASSAATTPVAPPAFPVGTSTGPTTFACVVGDTTPDGGNWRGVFIKHVVVTPFGSSCWWTLTTN